MFDNLQSDIKKLLNKFHSDKNKLQLFNKYYKTATFSVESGGYMILVLVDATTQYAKLHF